MIISEESQRNRQAYLNALVDLGKDMSSPLNRMRGGDKEEVHEVPVDQLAKEMWLLFKMDATWKDGSPIFDTVDEDKGLKQLADRLRHHYNRDNIQGWKQRSEGTGLNARAKGGKLWLVREDAEETLKVYCDLASNQPHNSKRVEDMPRGFLGGRMGGKKLKKVFNDTDPKVHEKVILDVLEEDFVVKTPELPSLPILPVHSEKTYIISVGGEERISVQATSIIGAKALAFDRLGCEIRVLDLKGPLVSKG